MADYNDNINQEEDELEFINDQFTEAIRAESGENTEDYGTFNFAFNQYDQQISQIESNRAAIEDSYQASLKELNDNTYLAQQQALYDEAAMGGGVLSPGQAAKSTYETEEARQNTASNMILSQQAQVESMDVAAATADEKLKQALVTDAEGAGLLIADTISSAMDRGAITDDGLITFVENGVTYEFQVDDLEQSVANVVDKYGQELFGETRTQEEIQEWEEAIMDELF